MRRHQRPAGRRGPQHAPDPQRSGVLACLDYERDGESGKIGKNGYFTASDPIQNINGLGFVQGELMSVEECQLLAAVNRVRGIVNIENNASRNGFEAIAEQVDHRQSHTPQFMPRCRILQAR